LSIEDIIVAVDGSMEREEIRREIALRKTLVLTFEYPLVLIRSVYSLSSVIVDAPFRCTELVVIVYRGVPNCRWHSA
jgi:hypothetical protein